MTILHQVGDFLRETLSAVPLSAVRILFVGSLVAVAVWVLALPKSETSSSQSEGRWDGNLKLLAVLALAIQVVIYSFL